MALFYHSYNDPGENPVIIRVTNNIIKLFHFYEDCDRQQLYWFPVISR